MPAPWTLTVATRRAVPRSHPDGQLDIDALDDDVRREVGNAARCAGDEVPPASSGLRAGRCGRARETSLSVGALVAAHAVAVIAEGGGHLDERRQGCARVSHPLASRLTRPRPRDEHSHRTEHPPRPSDFPRLTLSSSLARLSYSGSAPVSPVDCHLNPRKVTKSPHPRLPLSLKFGAPTSSPRQP